MPGCWQWRGWPYWCADAARLAGRRGGGQAGKAGGLPAAGGGAARQAQAQAPQTAAGLPPRSTQGSKQANWRMQEALQQWVSTGGCSGGGRGDAPSPPSSARSPRAEPSGSARRRQSCRCLRGRSRAGAASQRGVRRSEQAWGTAAPRGACCRLLRSCCLLGRGQRPLQRPPSSPAASQAARCSLPGRG